mgnify:FL=1
MSGRQTPLRLSLHCCLFVVFCASAGAGKLTITGRAVTPEGRPAAGATVFSSWHFVDDAGHSELVEADTTADETGAFTLVLKGEGEPEGEWERGVAAMMDGYGVGWGYAALGETTGITVTLTESTVATGVVVDNAGQPIAGASVSIRYLYPERHVYPVILHDHLSATTDAVGRFMLRGLPVGVKARGEAIAEGYQRLQPPTRLPDQLVDMTITLEPATSISGRIMRDGEPVEGMHVSAGRVSMAGYSGGTGVSGEDGAYTVTGLAPGRYAVSLDWRLSADAIGDRTAAAHCNVECNLDAPATGIDFELIQGGYVTGRLVDAETGEVIPRGGVTAYPAGAPLAYDAIGPALISPDGTYRLHLPAGTYRLSGGARGYVGQGGSATSEEVTVDTGQIVEGVDFALARQTRITGNVVDADGNPVGGALLHDLSAIGPPRTIPKSGRFDIPMGYYGFPTELCFVHAERGLIRRLTVTGETTDACIVLEPGAVATGQVVNPEGQGVAGLQVSASYSVSTVRANRPATVFLPHAPTDDDGYFRLSWLPHGVEVTVYVAGEDGRFISDRKWAKSVTFIQGEELDLGPTVLDRAGQTLAGRVMDAERELQADCLVIDLGTGQVARTDEMGRFELTGLPLLAHASAVGMAYRPDILAVAPRASLFCLSSAVDLGVGHELDMVIEPLGNVRGRVLNAAGQPVAGFGIELLAGHTAAWSEALSEYNLGANLTARAQTGDDGCWEFDGLIPGLDYSVYATADFARISEGFRAIPGDTVDLGDLHPPVENGG